MKLTAAAASWAGFIALAGAAIVPANAADGPRPNIVYIGIELYNIAQDPYEQSNAAAANPDKVAALQKRANGLAATMAKSLLLQTEFGAMRERLRMPPALPGEETAFNDED